MICFKRLFGLALASLLTVTLVWSGPAMAGGPVRLAAGLIQAAADDQSFVPVIVLLKGHQTLSGLRLTDSPQQLNTIRNAVSAAQAEVLNGQRKNNFRLERRFSLIPAFSARVNKSGLARLAADPNVAAIQANPSLKLLTEQGLSRIQAISARESYGGAGVAIAIVDTGVDYTHPALGGGGFPNAKVIGGYDFGDNDADPQDDVSPVLHRGHGTACAGIAAGDNTDQGDFSGGVAPQAKIYALKIMDSAGGMDLAAAFAAWEWALVHKNDDPANPILVISNSWSSVNHYTSYCDNEDPTGATILASLKANGITVVSAAGNEGACNALASPACLADSLSVGAAYDDFQAVPRAYAVAEDSCAGKYEDDYDAVACIDATAEADQIACYSNSGPVLDLIAPSDCTAAPAPGNNYYECFNGTSAGAAYTAGAAAVVQSWALTIATPLSPNDLKDRLVDHGDCLADPKSGLSRARVNIEQAIAAYGGGGCGPRADAQTTTALETVINLTAGNEASFVIEVPAGALELKATLTGATGNIDLFTRFGLLASATEYDCASTLADWNDEACIHRAPAAGSWYVTVRGIDGLAGFSGNLKVTYTTPRESQGTAQWGVINYTCCLNGEEYVYSGTIEGVTKTSRTTSCTDTPTWTGYATTTAGLKSFDFSRSGCQEEGSGQLELTLAAGGCYYVALDFQNGVFVQTLYRSEDCTQPASISALGSLTEGVTEVYSMSVRAKGDGLSTTLP